MTSKLIYFFMDCETFLQFVLNAPFLYPLKRVEKGEKGWKGEKGCTENKWINQLPAFEKIKGLFSTCSNIFYETFSKIASNVRLKVLTNLVNRIILDASVDRECACKSGYNAALAIQTEIFPKLGITLINHFHLKYWQVIV